MPLPKIEVINLTEEEKQVKKSPTYEECRSCKQKCCRSIGIEVDTPETREDFSEFLWMIAHKNVAVYIEEGAWHIEFITDCEKLDEKGNCQIYEKRPAICREHATNMIEEDLCEGFQNPYETYDHYFTEIEELEAFIPGYLSQLAEAHGESKKLINRVKALGDTMLSFFLRTKDRE